MRTFIAVELDDSIKQNLSALVDVLRQRGGRVRWIKRQGMHITLKFLGEIEQRKVSEIESVLTRVTSDYKQFSLIIRGTGYFPDERNPRVIWAGVDADDSLFAIQRQMENELEKTGFPREKRTFRPHLTLGRVKSTSSIGATIRELHNYREKLFGEMIVRKITFFRSVLKPSGAEYSVLSENHLK